MSTLKNWGFLPHFILHKIRNKKAKAILVSVRQKARDVFLVKYQKPFYLNWKHCHIFIPVLEASLPCMGTKEDVVKLHILAYLSMKLNKRASGLGI